MIVLSNNTEHLDIRNECNVWNDTNKEIKKKHIGLSESKNSKALTAQRILNGFK